RSHSRKYLAPPMTSSRDASTEERWWISPRAEQTCSPRSTSPHFSPRVVGTGISRGVGHSAGDCGSCSSVIPLRVDCSLRGKGVTALLQAKLAPGWAAWIEDG